MDRFTKILHRLIVFCTGIGSIFLAAIMLIIVASIIVRIFGKVVPGSYETIELIIVVTIAFALPYCGMHKGHVSVDLILKKFPERAQNIINAFNHLISMIFWGALGVVAYAIAFEKGWMEITDYFRLSYMPFRIVFGLGLLFLAFNFLIEMYHSLKRGLKR
jgi:TRAP-type C4-dicarboxylate transport system permease small subunit